MAYIFRADEAAERNFERAKRYLIKPEWDRSLRSTSENYLRELTCQYGPVVDCYPTWHPLVRNHDPRNPETWPSERTGYKGLDHTVAFVNAFLTCPYAASGKAELLRQSMRAELQHHTAHISTEHVEAIFYSKDAEPILVTCEWTGVIDNDGQIPAKFAVPLMMQQELVLWGESQIAERWDTMKPYILGEPHGARSSFFVSQETAIALKKTYMGMVESGMFGPLRMG